ncbi:FecR family protein, partial [Escherichia coli]|nr:FecR family protein [Escherichia coli]
SVETAAGQRRVLTLGDGTRIEMSGGTRLTLDHHDNRIAALDRGQALFTVRHDAAHPFTLTAGGVAVRDLGTVFDVARDGSRLAVQVASGS